MEGKEEIVVEEKEVVEEEEEEDEKETHLFATLIMELRYLYV